MMNFLRSMHSFSFFIHCNVLTSSRNLYPSHVMLPDIPKGVSNAQFLEIGMISRGGFGKGVRWGGGGGVDGSCSVVLQHMVVLTCVSPENLINS